jgi:hypothetical protein
MLRRCHEVAAGVRPGIDHGLELSRAVVLQTRGKGGGMAVFIKNIGALWAGQLRASAVGLLVQNRGFVFGLFNYKFRLLHFFWLGLFSLWPGSEAQRLVALGCSVG